MISKHMINNIFEILAEEDTQLYFSNNLFSHTKIIDICMPFYGYSIEIELCSGLTTGTTYVDMSSTNVNLENISLSIEKTIEILTKPFFRIKNVIDRNTT